MVRTTVASGEIYHPARPVLSNSAPEAYLKVMPLLEECNHAILYLYNVPLISPRKARDQGVDVVPDVNTAITGKHSSKPAQKTLRSFKYHGQRGYFHGHKSKGAGERQTV